MNFIDNKVILNNVEYKSLPAHIRSLFKRSRAGYFLNIDEMAAYRKIQVVNSGAALRIPDHNSPAFITGTWGDNNDIEIATSGANSPAFIAGTGGDENDIKIYTSGANSPAFITGTGGDKNDIKIYTSGANSDAFFYGSSGAETISVYLAGNSKAYLYGGDGNDIYFVDSIAVTIVELDKQGVDTVSSSISWSLGSNLENLILSDTGNINGKGNALNNILMGNTGNNVLDGMGGTDILTGGAGADTFRFSTKPKFGASTADHITDFNAFEGDSIQVSKRAFGMASNATVSLTTVGSASELTAALGSTSTFVYDNSNGNLYWNQNGNKSGFGTGGIFAVLDNHSALSASNISLF